MAEFKQSTKLHNVLYDIRGPILQAAQQMEAEGHRILKLNIGNPAPFGFEAPDAILVPTPDYPLWTASVALAGGRPVHYLCDEDSGWQPDLEDLEAKITPRTKGIVVINPNNPTGAVYPESTLRKIVALAEKHGLVLFADEIYEKIL